MIHEVSGVMFPPPGTITAVIKVCPAFKTLLKAVSVVPAIGTVLDGKYILTFSCHLLDYRFLHIRPGFLPFSPVLENIILHLVGCKMTLVL